MPQKFLFFCLGVLAAGLLPLDAAVPPALHGFVEKYCVDCHDAESKKGGIDFDALDFSNDPDAHAKWVRIFDQVLTGEMPPEKKPRADENTKRAFLTTLGQGLLNQHLTAKGTVLRRLNRAEYENTLRDLLGIQVDVRELLPEDSISHGFDNIGEALSMSDVQLARYMEAAEAALNAALQRVTLPEAKKLVLDYKKGAARHAKWLDRPDGSVVLYNNGIEPDTTLKSFRATAEAKYRIKVMGYAHQSATEAVSFALHGGKFDGKSPTDLIGYYEVVEGSMQTITVDAWLKKGDTIKLSPGVRTSETEFQQTGPDAYPGPGLGIMSVEIEGPLYDSWPPRAVNLLFGDLAKGAKEVLPPPPKEKGKKQATPAKEPEKPLTMIEVVSANPDMDAARLLRGFTAAAFRRPVDEATVAPYLALFRGEMKKGSTFSIAMRTAAIAILCAPEFLYLREPAGKLDDFALASRLSYFLWRTMPDDELLRLAQGGQLRNPAVLRAQTERLLAHPSFGRFAVDFTDSWLNLRDIDFTSPDRKLYPEFEGQLQDAMLGESRAFLRELIKSNLGPTNIVQSDFAMLNNRLAEHYKIPDIKGVEIRKVKITPEAKRGGVLTQGAVLKVSANGTNTSPVMRGAYVLERILGTPPQPPPPEVPGLEPDTRGASTLRQLLEKHREMESCNSCHKEIDPPGFALESYDVIGGFREKFRSTRRQKGKIDLLNGPPVDATGEMADGRKFTTFADFQKILLAKPDQITRCITEKLLTFASGRELGFSDRNEVTRIVNEMNAKKGGMRDLVHLVVGSQIFQTE